MVEYYVGQHVFVPKHKSCSSTCIQQPRLEPWISPLEERPSHTKLNGDSMLGQCNNYQYQHGWLNVHFQFSSRPNSIYLITLGLISILKDVGVTLAL